MNRDSLAKMRLDRRLTTRPGWIGPDELEQLLAALPDVADKATTLGGADDQRGLRAPAAPGEISPGA